MAWLGKRYAGWVALAGCLGWGLIAAVVLAGGADKPPGSGEPLWPLDLPTRYLTSNFMEYRSGRFHAGLDLKTQSRSGFAVRAVENGSIVRVRATPFAYGRAVYLLGDSGRTYVFAHLSRFNDPIRARVNGAREKSGRYRVRLHFAPGEMTVRRGEVLGLSGESGTGGPHLHFEVRDPDNGPVNPLAVGFAVPDTFAPVIHAVRAVPADARSRIDGGATARVLKTAGGLSGDQPELQVAGPVAFAAKIIDAADVRGHKLEPWLIEVRLDDELVYRCRNDRFDFSENSLQRLEWLEVPGIRDHWLHRRSGNALRGREGQEWFRGTGGEGLDPGPHTLEVKAADHAGNTTSVTIPLLVAAMAFPQPPAAGAWLDEPVRVVVDSLSGMELRPLVDDEPEPPGSLCLDASAGDPVLAPTTLAVVGQELGRKQLERARRQGLRPAGPVARYLAADWPIDAAVPVALTGEVTAVGDSLPGERDPAVGVYRWSRDSWRPAGSVMEPAGEDAYPRFALSSPGLFAVFRDEAFPRIFAEESAVIVATDPRGQVFGVSLPRWEIFPVSLADEGSGIAPESIAATLDGLPLIVEPDLPRERILVELPDDLAAGSHVLLLKVRDEAGNEAEAEVQIDCRE